ncbi:MAG: hypothetical protein E3J80_01375 [Hadesarchaea archaeon]|nr:MAG: hypothetical protein E3J80_01375 [Hadesarchaea archaeon]
MGQAEIRRLRAGQRASAPTLAVFTIFVILCSSVAIVTFQSLEERSVSAIILKSAADVVRATASQVGSELNSALESSIAAAMYDVGLRGGTREQVEQYVREYLNTHISSINAYPRPNLTVVVPPCDENSLALDWLPDGGIRARGYLDARFEHVMGPRAFGLSLRAVSRPRFERIKHVAEVSVELAAGAVNLEELERALNENYACEGLAVELENEDDMVHVTVQDTFGARGVLVPQ